MKPSTFVLVAVSLGVLAGCQGQCVRDRAAQAVPAPSPAASVEPAAVPSGGAASPALPLEDAGLGSGPTTTDSGRGAPAADSVPQSPSAARGRQTAGPVSTAPQEAVVPAQSTPVTTVARPAPLVLPAGTELPVRLEQTLASDVSRPEERVTATLIEDAPASGRVVLPSGTEVIGHVVVAQRSGRVKGKARLVVSFDEIRTHGKSYRIDAPRWDVTAASSRGRDTKIAGGAAAAGAIIGAIKGGGKGALKGAAIGGAAGGAAVLVTRGEEVELPAGSQHKVTLRQELRME